MVSTTPSSSTHAVAVSDTMAQNIQYLPSCQGNPAKQELRGQVNILCLTEGIASHYADVSFRFALSA